MTRYEEKKRRESAPSDVQILESLVRVLLHFPMQPRYFPWQRLQQNSQHCMFQQDVSPMGKRNISSLLRQNTSSNGNKDCRLCPHLYMHVANAYSSCGTAQRDGVFAGDVRAVGGTLLFSFVIVHISLFQGV